MRIIVTGGAGFIGSHVVDAYIEAGHEVGVVDNLWEKGGGKVSNVNARATLYRADITDLDELSRIFREVKPEVVNHHAAQHSVSLSTKDPRFDARVNILGLLNILRCTEEVKVEKVIFASSGATYGMPDDLPINESAKQEPESPYGISKMMGERYIRYWRQAYGLRYSVLRYGNVYGPRQDPGGEAGVVGIFAQRFLKGEGIRMDWDGEQRKDYVYVGDVARANVEVLGRGENETYGIGGGRGVSVQEIYQTIASVVGWTVPVVRAPKRPGDIYLAYFDVEKAWRELNWKAEVGLEEGIRATIAFLHG